MIKIDALLCRDSVGVRLSLVAVIMMIVFWLVHVFTPTVAVLVLCDGVLFSLHEQLDPRFWWMTVVLQKKRKFFIYLRMLFTKDGFCL